MKKSISLSLRACIGAGLGLAAASSAIPGPITAAQAQQAAQSEMIVILRDQLPNVPPTRRAMGARTMSIAESQRAVVGHLQQMRARKVASFSTINAFATRLSAVESAELLAAHPEVQAIVPDRVIRAPHRAESAKSATVTSAAGASADSEGTAGLCGTLEPEALQLTHTAFLNSSTAQAQTVIDGKGQPVTGKGVKVAFLADGLDPNIAGFIRPDGSHVFIDYQDFSGDPAGTPTAGGEAFGDASSIAAQDDSAGKLLTYDLSKFVNAAHPLPSPCNIHIRGMAPGASLVGLKVFSNLGYTTTSSFVQAIEYAVVHDDVDVINESFGGNPYPDNDNDPISLANNAAVKAGTTVTVSTGDAGSAGTLGSPSTNSDVIAVGASTQFRGYAQTGYYVQPIAHGYLSNNISALSSGGFSQLSARTVDVVAPGDLGWALCSTNQGLYFDCSDFTAAANPTAIQLFGGTSESSPLTAGEAALVIQAYRSTHGGADPSPALVKQIIMSTATDLGAPSSEQGAGLINSLAAVNVALSIDDGQGRPKARGPGIYTSATGVSIVAEPNANESRTFTITNTGSTTRHLTPSLQMLGAPIAGATLNLNLAPSSEPVFLSPTGAQRSYIEQKFTVPSGAQHLDAAIAFQVSLTSSATPYGYLALLDPSGREAAYSLPQGAASGYAHVDVVKPVAGTWTAVIFTRTSGVGSYTGPVQFTWAAERFVDVGAVHPATLHLAPGASESVTADFFMPSEPGDVAAGLRFLETEADDGGGNHGLPEIPVSLRALIPVGPSGGTFTGTLTGGNGRPGAGPTQTFEFDVPAGVHDMSLVLQIPDNGYLLEGLLVDPHGMQLSVEPNVDPFGNVQYALQQFHDHPQPGRWRFILVQDFYSSGNQTSLGFSARIGFNNAQVTASGLPTSPNTKLSASGTPVTATISVTNTGAISQAYFADARTAKLGVAALPGGLCAASATLPGTLDCYNVPPQVSTVEFIAVSTSPIQMDAFNDVGYLVGGTGNPDIFAKQVGPGTVIASLTEPEIPYGLWLVAPALIGPYGPAGAPTTPVATSAFALMKPFDAAISADSGDYWADLILGTSTFNPLLLGSGAQGTITVTITPDSSQVGQTISGYIYIDTFNPTVGTGDEVVSIPYTYTVAP
jgi:hypothetical protein